MQEATTWQGGGARAPPSEAMDVDAVPRGADDCLSGETFVITGVQPHLSRCAAAARAHVSLARVHTAPNCVSARRSEDAEALIKRHGGRVTSALSGKTSFLLVRQLCI